MRIEGKKISELGRKATPIDGGEELAAAQSRSNFGLTVSEIETHIDPLKESNVGAGLVVDPATNNFRVNFANALPVSTPNISVDWQIFNQDGTTPYSGTFTQGAKAITLHLGAVIRGSAFYNWNTAGGTRSVPTSASGDFGTTIPSENNSSATLTINTTNNFSASITLTNTSTGIKVENGGLTEGDIVSNSTDTITATQSTFYYFGTSPLATLTASDIQLLQFSGFGGKNVTFNNVVAAPGEYTYFCYPSSLGVITGIFLNGPTDIEGAFNNDIGTVDVTLPTGRVEEYYVYRSNATEAFTNDTIRFE